MEFKILEQFKNSLKDYTIIEGRRIFHIKTNKRMVRVACVHERFMVEKEIQKEKAKTRLRAKRKAKAKKDTSNVGETDNAYEIIDNSSMVPTETNVAEDDNAAHDIATEKKLAEANSNQPNPDEVSDIVVTDRV